MKRPIYVITLGFIIGIIWGLYFNIVSYIFLSIIILLIALKITDNKFNYKISGIIKILLKKSTIITLVISMFVGFIYLLIINKTYINVYNNIKNKEFVATIISDKKESEYSNTYLIKVEEPKTKFLMRTPKQYSNNFKYGDKIKFYGEYDVPEIARNYKGFNYREYLKTQGIYGILKTNKAEIIKHSNLNKISLLAYEVKHKIINNMQKILPADTKDLFLGILIGYDNELGEDIKESFKISSLSHLLAVSGAHIACLISGLSIILRLNKIGKKLSNVLIILLLMFFMYITDFTPSVVRAVIMGSLVLLQILLYRKQDIKISMSFSILLILISNPYKILDIGLILSYSATIGIVLVVKIRKLCKYKNKENSKIVSYLIENILITVSANIIVIPIIMYNFNTVSLNFIISNLIAGILMESIILGGMLLIILSFINLRIAYIISIPYNALLKILIFTGDFVSKIPFSQIIISTPNLIFIVLYYILLYIVFYSIYIIKKYHNRFITKKIIFIYKKIFDYIKKKRRVFFILILTLILLILILKIIPKNPKIYFIDVGQGDSTLILTPTNKKILIDGGGSENFDVGKNTLFPYLLDRQITQIDYMVISHFDTDHCRRFNVYIRKYES